MPKINTYTDNATIEDVDAVLTYDPAGSGATKLTTFGRIATWVSAKLAGLAKKTTISSADQILMVNGSAANRIDYNVLAKAIIENYAASSLAGASQSVKAALDKSPTSLGTAVTDLNSVTTPGSYRISDMANAENAPSSVTVAGYSAQIVVLYRATSARVIQILYVYRSANYTPTVYIRMQTGDSAWSAWVDMSASDRLFNSTGGNIDATNIDDLTTPCIYNRYIDLDSIVGYGGKHFGVLMVSCPPTAQRIGQYIFMPATGCAAFRYHNGTSWGTWRTTSAEVYNLVRNLAANEISEATPLATLIPGILDSAQVYMVTLTKRSIEAGASSSSVYLVRTTTTGITEAVPIYEGTTAASVVKLDSSYKVTSASYAQPIKIVAKLI